MVTPYVWANGSMKPDFGESTSFNHCQSSSQLHMQCTMCMSNYPSRIPSRIFMRHVSAQSRTDTWLEAFDAGTFAGWPGLILDQVRKDLHKIEETVKFHVNQQRQNTKSTHDKEPHVNHTGARYISRGQTGLCVCYSRNCGNMPNSY
jgi:hypothetical protein